jgi:hypothetical protein
MVRPETLNFFWSATGVQKFTNVFLFGGDWYLILNNPSALINSAASATTYPAKT